MDIKYTLTNDNITVVWQGKPYVIVRGAPNYHNLRKAILEEDMAAIPNHLTVAKSIKEWAKGAFTVDEHQQQFFFKNVALQRGINERVIKMATHGEDPTPWFIFWEKLQQNPSWRSVMQLFNFIEHEHIPLTKDGCFLAYKKVREDYTDSHTGQVDNRPGTTNEMARNLVSDDPNEACHFGFHVGALSYAKSFSGSRLIICKVDPKDVVCVPYDSSQQKMRVCKYVVVGNYNGQPMPDTIIDDEDYQTFSSTDDDGYNENDDAAEEDEITAEGEVAGGDKEVVENVVQLPIKQVLKEQGKGTGSGPVAVPKKYDMFQKKGSDELILEPLADLREYATYGLKIVGASKIAGGKIALVQRILEIRQGTEAEED